MLSRSDTPAPGGRGGRRRLQGFSPGQNSTALTVEHTVDIPVQHGGGRRRLHDLSPGQGWWRG